MSEPITLRDAASGSTAKVLPSLGFNLFSFQPVVAGQPHEVLWSAPDFAGGQQRPSGSGVPILFPHPGRIRGSSYEFEGRTYQLEPDPRGNVIHGFVFKRPWRVVAQSEASVTGEFHAAQDDPSILERWPADFRIQATYTLRANCLRGDIEIENPSDRPLPFGLGLHPYFRLPLGPQGTADDCEVRVPLGSWWELAEMLPTGGTRPAAEKTTLAGGVKYADIKLDDVFSGLEFDGDDCVSTIRDPQNRRQLKLTFGRDFPFCVMFTPQHRQAICIEPYSCAPDPFNLTKKGIDAGLRVAPPGGAGPAMKTHFEIELSQSD